MDPLLSLRPALTAAAACLATFAAVPAAHATDATPAPASAADFAGQTGAPSHEALLAAIAAQAPETNAIADVVPAPDGAHLAIRTRAQAGDEGGSHDELWLSAGDGSELVPLSRTSGSAAQYVSIGSVSWSADGARLAYGYLNAAARRATAAHVVTLGAPVPVDVRLGDDTTDPQFSLDRRYVTFLQYSGGIAHASGALDLASGDLLLPARVDYLAPDGSTVTPPWLAPACARAAQPGWAPSQTSGRWLEQALSSPDPGCRFGANAGDPGPAVPNVAGASDAPAGITKSVGNDLVTIAERTAPLGPTVRIRSSAKGLTRALRRGLRLQIDLAGAKTVKAYVLAQRPAYEDDDTVTVSGDTREITLGRASFKDLPSQAQAISVPLTREAKRMLPRFLKITVTVRIVAIDKAGHRTVVERVVALTDF